MTDFENYVIARWAYSVGKPIMPDARYTILDRVMKSMYPDNEYTKRTWSEDPCPVELLKQYGREDLIYSVVISDKTESIPSLNNWVELQEEYYTMHGKHRVSFKLDGWNIQASYWNTHLVNVQTRGRSTDAMDASVLRKLLPQRIPVMGKALITMELLIPNADFEWFRKTFHVTSQRAAVSTALANPGAGTLDHVKLIAHGLRCSMELDDMYKQLKACGFEVPMCAYVENYDELKNQIKAFSEYKSDYPYPTDGLVCDGGNKVRAIRVMGWQEPILISYVTGYEESYGPHSIGIQCKIYPINTGMSTQRVVPATNLKRIIELNLRPGYPIAFRIASSAIADIDEESTILLQKKWNDNLQKYRWMIETNEALK